jgi:hypothetical protein
MRANIGDYGRHHTGGCFGLGRNIEDLFGC